MKSIYPEQCYSFPSLALVKESEYKELYQKKARAIIPVTALLNMDVTEHNNMSIYGYFALAIVSALVCYVVIEVIRLLVL